MPSSQPTVAIIGGGLAGLAAACSLSQSGFRVTVFERRPFLGGRASSYEHPATDEVVDNCQHVLFGCCTNLIAFYQTIGIENKIRWFDRMTFVEPGGRRSILQPSPLPAPLHIFPSLLRFKCLHWKDKLALARGAVALMRSGHEDAGNFQQWLERHQQTPAAVERFWKPILVSALSEDLDRIAVPYAAQVVRESMKSAAARRMGVPTVPLTDLYNAARDFIAAHNGSIRLRSSAQAMIPGPKSVRVRLPGSEEEFDYCVLAAPFDSAAKLLPDTPEAAPLREKIAHFETSPITGVHFWFDRQITELPHAVLLDRTIQWMFHKSLLLTGAAVSQSLRIGTAAEVNVEQGRRLPNEASESLATMGVARVTPGTVPEGRENTAQGVSPGYVKHTTESRRDGTTPSYVELVISSSKSLINKSRQEIIDLALNELREFFPEARNANLLKATVIKELNATFSPTAGIDQFRPATRTPWPRVFLAGDWVATGWPATMEGAVRSGYLAAEALTRNSSTSIVPDLPATGLMRLLVR